MRKGLVVAAICGAFWCGSAQAQQVTLSSNPTFVPVFGWNGLFFCDVTGCPTLPDSGTETRNTELYTTLNLDDLLNGPVTVNNLSILIPLIPGYQVETYNVSYTGPDADGYATFAANDINIDGVEDPFNCRSGRLPFDWATCEYEAWHFEASGPVAMTSSTPILAPPVPEPATWAMMLLGFGAIGLTMRRKLYGCSAAM